MSFMFDSRESKMSLAECALGWHHMTHLTPNLKNSKLLRIVRCLPDYVFVSAIVKSCRDRLGQLYMHAQFQNICSSNNCKKKKNKPMYINRTMGNSPILRSVKMPVYIVLSCMWMAADKMRFSAIFMHMMQGHYYWCVINQHNYILNSHNVHNIQTKAWLKNYWFRVLYCIVLCNSAFMMLVLWYLQDSILTCKILKLILGLWVYL